MTTEPIKNHLEPDVFSGNRKVGRSILHEAEQKFIAWAVPHVPSWIHTTHLTLATIPISLLIILCGFLAVGDRRWFWAISVLIALQWLTDSLDGAVGRARGSGLVRWGYYMDHLLDYFFLASVLISYLGILTAETTQLSLLLFTLIVGFMVNSYLMMAASNKFQVSHFGFGPTEGRLLAIIVNVLIAVSGKTHVAFLLPVVLVVGLAAFVAVVYKEQRELWRADLQRRETLGPAAPPDDRRS